MNFPDKKKDSRLIGRARFEGAPAPVAVRLLRPNLVRAAAQRPVRLGLNTHGALGGVRNLTISR